MKAGRAGEMSYNYFMDKIADETEHMPKIISIFESLGYKLVSDVRLTPEYQKKDIDLIFNDKTFGDVTVEVKIRLKDYGDLLVETYSCKERQTLGNLYASQAYFYAYAIIEKQQLKKLYVAHMPSLRQWFDKNKNKYNPKLAPNPPTNTVYHTEFYAIPIQDIPEHIFIIKVMR
jgi:hypothetical protein